MPGWLVCGRAQPFSQKTVEQEMRNHLTNDHQAPSESQAVRFVRRAAASFNHALSNGGTMLLFHSARVLAAVAELESLGGVNHAL